nr:MULTISPECIES: 16S rRNA (guanine(966)-N(2))-methyltransferase RsmD [Anaerotruncus]
MHKKSHNRCNNRQKENQMRVITGTARGTRLQAPEGLTTRPTSDMAKEAIFSILHFEVEQAMVLDLFAGSGQLGIEALSRGAKSCIFVDTSRAAQEVIRRNLAAAKLAAQARVAAMDVNAFLQSAAERFDIAFLDPPYGQKLIDAVLPRLAEKMNETGIIVCETERNEELPESAGEFLVYKTYRYGKAKITTYRHQNFGKD